MFKGVCVMHLYYFLSFFLGILVLPVCSFSAAQVILSHEDKLAKVFDTLSLEHEEEECEGGSLDVEKIKELILGDEKDSLQARVNEYTSYIDLLHNMMSVFASPQTWLTKLKMKTPF